MARRTLRKCADQWPINLSIGNPPDAWPGWPGGKKFALVLTHDVESKLGLDNCHLLAALERSLGFRSSFNFIPEGSYHTPETLRHGLVEDGFEVGVHDWRHDGKLYRSYNEFQIAAKRINVYIKEWGASGFRSGFMHHNLGWLHALDISYDMSTFDTDPFEPQPDGVDTIFPFWVPAPSSGISTAHSLKATPRHPPLETSHSSSGYVELPYTLPQDSTLFLLLQHTDNAIWKRKMDWIAREGGMALLNVHPDYINFDNAPTTGEYPVRYYSDFLRHILDAYGNDVWFALPSEMAAFVRAWKAMSQNGTNPGAAGSTIESLSAFAGLKDL
jgi:peptidoglycan/xylan/chitin deacetylase (PgdA/CDA1 family)